MTTIIKDPLTSDAARVDSRGQLVTAPLEFSDPIFNNLAIDNTVYNYTVPVAGKRFVITGLVANATRSVGVNGTVVELYEASAVDSATVDKEIFTFDMARSTSLTVNPLNLIVSEGVWLNARCDDAEVFLTILGYCVDA